MIQIISYPYIYKIITPVTLINESKTRINLQAGEELSACKITTGYMLFTENNAYVADKPTLFKSHGKLFSSTNISSCLDTIIIYNKKHQNRLIGFSEEMQSDLLSKT